MKQREAVAERISTQVNGVLERLKLNDEQREKSRIDHGSELRAATCRFTEARYGPEKPRCDCGRTFENARRNDLGKVINKTEKELRKVLNDDQMNVWKKATEKT